MATEPEPVADIVPTEPAPPRKLYRSNTQRVVAGVCGGLGEYTGVDPVWYRIGFVLLTIGGGSGVLIYLLMWLIVQPAPQGYTPSAPGQSQGSVTGLAILGIVLVIVGTVALVNTVAPAMGQYVWPLAFVVGGLALVVGGLNRDAHR